ncbi:MAG: shikimate kinase [Thermoguttaceae bacterium]
MNEDGVLTRRGLVPLVLVGYRATGKTTLARLLADRLGKIARDSDVLVEQRAGKSIARIFAENGEPFFRDLEATVIRELLEEESDNLVLATGGGAILRDTTRVLLKQSAFVVWLHCSAEMILRRMNEDRQTVSQRPALTDLSALEEVKTLLEKREPFYREVARCSVDTESTPLESLSSHIAREYSGFGRG